MRFPLSSRDRQTLDYIRRSGASQRCVLIDYEKLGGERSRRVVEPYLFQHSGDNLMVCCWQVNPDCGEDDAWRNFRIDRITAVADGGVAYTPRRAVNLAEAREFAMDVQPGGTLDSVNEYFSHVWAAMGDARFTVVERDRAAELAARLSPAQVRAVHAQLLRDALQECLLDGEITDYEMEFLEKARRFLKRVGWVP
jgi:hypothetical protein